MKSILSLIISTALVVSGYGQTRNVLVGTNSAVVQPTNFWSADAVNARSGLGLGSAATNPASAFQPSSIILSNLALSNAGSLTNITASSVVGTVSTATNVTGVVAIANGGSGASNAATARTNFGLVWSGLTNSDAAGFRSALSLGTAATNPASAFQAASSVLTNISSSNAVNLTNIRATNIVGTIPLANIPTLNFTNITGTLSITAGGTGSTNATDARTALGLGSAATNPASAFQPASSVLTNLASNNAASLTNIAISNIVNLQSNLDTKLATNGNGSALTSITAANITGTVGLASNVTGTVAITNGGSGATTVGGARTNLGLVWTGLTNTNASGFRSALELSATWLTNTNVTNFRTAVGLGVTNTVEFSSVGAVTASISDTFSVNIIDVESGGHIQFSGDSEKATTRTNLGLGWSALTNTNTGTGLVSVNTNGEVVSPTNFWQKAPIQTLVQDLTVVVSTQTNNATNARNLYVYSLNTNLINGISNIILLPTNAATFAGDEVTVIHQGTTNTTTVVRQAGSTNNLITLNRFDESVKFIRELGQWDFYHNISFVEPIQFSGTNAAANAAASRTNLGLGSTNAVIFGSVTAGTDSVGLVNFGITGGGFDGIIDFEENKLSAGDGDWNFDSSGIFNVATIAFVSTTNAAATRTNLGLPLAALTNTNNANFQAAVFNTNTTPAGANFNNVVAWMEVHVITNGSNTSFRVPLFK